MGQKESINIFWFKRDLRLIDNEALSFAIAESNKLLLVYIYEPKLWQDSHYSQRHQSFVLQSLQSLSSDLASHHSDVLLVSSEVISFFESIKELYHVEEVYSTEETGIELTYQRDKNFKKFCLDNDIVWKEFQNNGVIRGLRNRDVWRKRWYQYMKVPQAQFNPSKAQLVQKETIIGLSKKFSPVPRIETDPIFQRGGREQALKWKRSFFDNRVQYYSDYISKPDLARMGCSRLSPYFAWGNLSIREIYQEALELKKTSSYKRQLNAFMSRLRWQSHFVQKFEMEPRMEFEAVNRGFLSLNQPINKNFVAAWKNGLTGYPLVDASIRCVMETGYINFRMRSMIVSFFTHHLFQHFSLIGPWLARQFLDFEPGIHYGQMQMQAGFTGTNTVRVYNPTKNALDHDSEAIFIKKHVPELRNLPSNLAIEPWIITPMESELYNFEYGTDYPKRIVDTVETRKYALKQLYGQRKNDLARTERQRILETHTIRRN